MPTLTPRSRRPRGTDAVVRSRRQATLTELGRLSGWARDVDFDKLSEREERDFVELTAGRAKGELDEKQTSRWKRLLAKSTGRKPDAIEKAEQEKETMARFAELARRAGMPRRQVDLHPQGAVVLPPAVFQQFRHDGNRSALCFEHAGFLVWLVAQLENMEALNPRGRIEGEGDHACLVVERTIGPGQRFDAWERLAGGWLDVAKHLEKNRWLRLEQSGQTLRIYRGPRLLSATRRAA